MGWYDEPNEIKGEYERRAFENKREAGKLWALYKKAEGCGNHEEAKTYHDAAASKYSEMAENIAKSRKINNFDY